MTRGVVAALALLAPALYAALPQPPPVPPAGASSEAARRLHALLEEEWAAQLEDDPLLASNMGVLRYDDRLPSMTRADLERRAARARAALSRLAAIDRGALGETDRVSAAMFQAAQEDVLVDHEFGAWRMPITAESGFHTRFAQAVARMPLATVADYERYMARLRAFPAHVAQQIELMREGLRTGFTVPRVVLNDAAVRAHAVDDVEKSVFWARFAEFPPAVPAGERERLRTAGRAAVQEAVAGYRAFHQFLTREYIPGAREAISLSAVPRGREYYARLVRRFTTLEVSPEEVHHIGQAEVARIRGEMTAVMRRTSFAGDLPAFVEALRTDPRFRPRTAEELIQKASAIAKRMDGRLPSLFGLLPRQPYGVEPVPDDIAPRYTGGRYVPAPINGARAGTYWVNTHALESRTLYTLEALTLHEAVPGHHLQIALQQELPGLPGFRRDASVDAFVEGWALYAERLGLEAGFYRDPYSDFGRLTYEMWRACRLVVDTGMHALGWTREQALSFLAANTALSRHEIGTETDRYISWPGQALAYKMGELKIRELRTHAETVLGPAFDVRAFHDALLSQGAIPLTVLDARLRSWVSERAAAARP